MGKNRGILQFCARLLQRVFHILAVLAAFLAGGLVVAVLDFLYDPEFFRKGFKPEPSREAGLGRADLFPSRVKAGRGPRTVELRFTCGPGGISEGGGIMVVPCRLVDFGERGKRATWMFSSGWGLLQNRHPRLANYFSCALETSGPAALDVQSLGFFPWRAALRLIGRDFLRNLGVGIEAVDPMYFYLELRKIRIRVIKARLREGDVIRIVMGDTRGGSRGWNSPAHPIKIDMLVEADEKAMGQYRRLETTPILDAVGGRAVKLDAVLSSETGGAGRLLLRAVDCRGDVDPDHGGKVEVQAPDGMEINGNLRLSLSSGIVAAPYFVKSPGVYRVAVFGGGISGESNAVLAGGDWKLFWGDLHVHSALCDGLNDPRSFYQEARDGQGMDFAAITTHDTMERIEPSGRAEEWELLRDLRDEFNQSGRFVVLLGYEWSSHKQGHRGIYFAPDEPDPRVYAWVDEASDTPEKLERLLEGHDCIMVPHHTAWRRVFLVPYNWFKFVKMRTPASYVWSPAENEQQRLAEIYSMHGSSEVLGNDHPISHGNPSRFFPPWLRDDGSKAGYGNYIQEALASGLRLGIIAGSDRHDYATDERSHPVDIYPGGLTAVWADELSDEAIWRSLWNRRCYGTTGVRIVLEFSAEGMPMGSECFCGGSPRLEGRIIGTAAIANVELLRHDARGYSTAWSGGGGGVIEEAFDFRDSECDGEAFYYLRVEQEDGHWAWSSPIWLRR
jgi:Protein of unknown function (DUF3604)